MEVTVKLIKEPYKRDKDIKQLLLYIAGESEGKEHTRYCRGEGVSPKPEKAVRQMITVQKFYKKAVQNFGKKESRRIYHYIVSLPACADDVNCVRIAAAGIADIFSGRHQVYYGVHEDTENLHIHFAVNAVSYMDGKKWHKNKKELEKLEIQIRERAKEVFWG